MTMQVVGCSHHQTPIGVREQLAFSPDQTRAALAEFRRRFPSCEAVLISTCNRVELYTATQNGDLPERLEIVRFLAGFHECDPEALDRYVYDRLDEAAVRHLFTVASSLDSMVVGEPQILAQVKEAYRLATEQSSAGPLMHGVFQAARKVARRVASETAIHHRRVSIPSVAVADFAQQIFERFDDKQTLVIGAGEMAEETLRYLRDQGARDVTVVNRNRRRAEELARRWDGRALEWERRFEGLAAADLVISTTGAEEPVISLAEYQSIEAERCDRPLFILDLAVPRDVDPAIGTRPAV